uniref:Uncharacterized protein n=1 Tax=Anguilla anguilla TaxID=7936 RepID=A0A0E9WT34_ANGAN
MEGQTGRKYMKSTSEFTRCQCGCILIAYFICPLSQRPLTDMEIDPGAPSLRTGKPIKCSFKELGAGSLSKNH